MALLLVSAGVPLIVGGDEMYRTEFGNNNPFNLDNDKFYLDYGLPHPLPPPLQLRQGDDRLPHGPPGAAAVGVLRRQ